MPLLSICIPTYNRSESLLQTVESIINSDGFDEKVEIVISDNCSTDDTEQICRDYTNKYNNVKYYRQLKPTNIADENFIDALSFATGKYIKLNNDTAPFKANTLQFFLNKIQESLADGRQLLFIADIHHKKFISREKFYNKKIKAYLTENLDDFIDIVSTSVTWITNFGCWKEQFTAIVDKKRFIKASFMQVDWTLKLRTEINSTSIYIDDFYDTINVRKTNKVDFVRVHCNRYLSIYKFYLEQKLIKKETFEREKKRTLFNVILPITTAAKVSKNDFYSFEGFFCSLKEEYRDNLYFYYAIYVLLPCYIVYWTLRRVLRKMIQKISYVLYLKIAKTVNGK
ncbi:MAG: glycosyltransferase family 2 protein [Endomicrobiaceae bacterium]|nr:glycosyltransferase family 2 protein [Endomicrobiaceae bacterium]